MAIQTATRSTQMTAEEFYDWANRPENLGTRYELEAGKAVEIPSPGVRHGTVCWLLGLIIGQYLFKRGAGHATTNDAGLIVKRKPDTVRGPDLMVFLENCKYDDLEVKYTERIPALVVEVLSPDDRPGRTNRRIEQYIRRGVPLVWLVDPEDRTVTVYRPNEFHKVLEESEELTGSGVLPDFTCRIADLFVIPGEVIPPSTTSTT
jgi:Uma2 family endonuclease